MCGRIVTEVCGVEGWMACFDVSNITERSVSKHTPLR